MCKFKLGDYVYLQQIITTILDVITQHIILWAKKVFAFNVLLLEG